MKHQMQPESALLHYKVRAGLILQILLQIVQERYDWFIIKSKLTSFHVRVAI